MSTLSKKKKNEEDDSFNDILSGMPDLTPTPKPAGGKGAKPGGMPEGSSSQSPQEMRAMLDRAREGLEHLLRNELQRVEEGFNDAVTQMEGRLLAATEQLERMEKEHAALEEENQQHRRRLETLRSLAQQS